MDVLSCYISHKLMRLNTFSIFKVLPKLLEVTHDRLTFEEYISFLVFDLFGECDVKPPKIEPVESSYSEIQKRKQKKEERYIRETNGVGLNYILGEKFRS